MKEILRTVLRSLLNEEIDIVSVEYVSGGCINDAYCVTDDNKRKFFVKANYSKRYPDMFETEKHGLELLKAKSLFNIPNIIGVYYYDDRAFIIMEYISRGEVKSCFWQDFGRKLAIMHRQSEDYFGLDIDNYIGSLRQINRKHSNWIDFFVEERINKQLQYGIDNGTIEKDCLRIFERFTERLDKIFYVDKSSLLHGDLWSGNYMVDSGGDATIIDPAVYYGYREMDIAMTRLFGGFPQQFYDSYNEEYPFDYGWEERIDFCNVYPLLVHANLFGYSYLRQAKVIASRL